MYKVSMRVDGMACGACVMKVTSCLEAIGAKAVHCRQIDGATSFVMDEKPVLSDIIHAVKKYDYRPFDILIENMDAEDPYKHLTDSVPEASPEETAEILSEIRSMSEDDKQIVGCKTIQS